MTVSASTQTTAGNTTDREFVVERVFDAPRWMVFQAFSEPERIAQWWGPKGWTTSVAQMEFRPGGKWHYCMTGPDGEESWGISVYREIVAPERIVYTDAFSNPEGTPAEGMPEMTITLEFIDLGSKTKVISRTLFASAEILQSMIEMGMSEGFKETWDRLEEYLSDSMAAALEANQNVVIERVFDAPRSTVFDAWINPAHLAQWWGPHGFTNPVCEVDARPGGTMRIDMRAPDGSVFPMTGVIEEIVPPERLVFSDAALEDEQGVPQLQTRNTVTFAEENGKTRLTLQVTVLKASPEVAASLAGMDEGWKQSFDKLAAYLA